MSYDARVRHPESSQGAVFTLSILGKGYIDVPLRHIPRPLVRCFCLKRKSTHLHIPPISAHVRRPRG